MVCKKNDVNANNFVGTHDINDSSAIETHNGVGVLTDFIEETSATGALLSFIYVNEGVVNFELSHWITVNRLAVSRGYIPPLNFQPGEYIMYAYDIENNTRLQDGIAYQASSSRFTVNGGNIGDFGPAL